MKNARSMVILAFAALLVLGLYTSCERQSPTEPEQPAPGGPKPGGGTTYEVVKTASGFWERRTEYDWSIEKMAEPASIDICSGASGTITYTLTATRTMVSESEVYGVRGEICVTNTGGAPTENLAILEVIFYHVEGGPGGILISIPVDVSAKPVLNPGETYCYPYEVVFTPVEGAQYTNVARVSITNPVNTIADVARFELPGMPAVTAVDEEADVTEVEYCPTGFSCVPSDPGPWHLLDSDVIVFTKTVYNESAMCDTWYDLDNTVTLEEVDTHELRTDKARVSIYTCPCGYGCTLTIGYWKTHAGFHGNNADRVTQYLPIWLGNPGGTESVQVTTAAQAMEILSMEMGHPSNGITKLYAQLLGTKLNIANGADGGAIADVIEVADDFLADYDWQDWAGLSKPEKRMVLGWMSTLDDYNNGDIGPGHCD